jgi:tRNA pseudouridine32 synthase/23S rRNA pseudouridine746 synthase
MNAIGLPIVNDSFYPVALPAESDDFSKPLKLLAKSISFNDPVTNEPRLFTSLQNL